MNRLATLLMLAVAAAVGCGDSTAPLAVGTLERHRIELRAERQEPLTRLAVSEGDILQAGDLVAELDSRRAEAQLEQARASRDLAAARLAEVVRGARREEIDRARAQLAEAEATLIEKTSDLQRARDLVAQGVDPQSVLDSAEAAFAAATARRDSAHAALERQLNGSTVEEHDQARADLHRADAEVTRLLVDVERMRIVAPVSGTVDAIPFKVGDEPPVGAAVAVLLTGDAPFARVYVPAELRPTVAAGQAATVAVDGYPNPFEGKVRFVSSEAAFTPYYALTERDRGHFTYLAEIDLVSDAARDLPTGLPVEVSF